MGIVVYRHNDYLIMYFVAAFLLLIQGCTALKCYQCISLECTESQLFCGNVKEYVLSQLPDLYYGYDGQKVPLCPSPDDEDGWEELRRDTKYECETEKSEDATCVLGRFRVTSEIYETGKNILSHGTAVGCAKQTLMIMMKEAMKKSECDISSSKSKFRHSVRHFLEIEHCGRAPDMCQADDFCIPPRATGVKQFQEKPQDKSYSFTLILGIFLVLALAVIALTFLAPFCNG